MQGCVRSHYRGVTIWQRASAIDLDTRIYFNLPEEGEHAGESRVTEEILREELPADKAAAPLNPGGESIG